MRGMVFAVRRALPQVVRGGGAAWRWLLRRSPQYNNARDS